MCWDYKQKIVDTREKKPLDATSTSQQNAGDSDIGMVRWVVTNYDIVSKPLYLFLYVLWKKAWYSYAGTANKTFYIIVCDIGGRGGGGGGKLFYFNFI